MILVEDQTFWTWSNSFWSDSNYFWQVRLKKIVQKSLVCTWQKWIGPNLNNLDWRVPGPIGRQGRSLKYFFFPELGLDELELDEILGELEKDGIEDWKIKAYVKHLTKPDTFTEIFKIRKVLNVLVRYPKEMVDIIDQICSLSNKTELHFKLILSILRLCDLIKVKSVFEKDIFSQYVEMISEEIFEQELRTFLNKIVVTNKTDYEQDWLILG